MCKSLLAVLCIVLLGGPVGNAWAQASPTRGPKEKEQNKPTQLDKDAHLCGWWKFDETTGVTAADSSSHGRRGTLDGGMTFDENSVPGRVGKGLRFDGQRGSVRVEGFKGVPGTHPRTVAVWLQTDQDRGEIVAWGEEDAGRMWILGFIRRHVGVTPDGGYLYIKDRISDGQWHHVAAVVRKGDPPNLYDSVSLYVDGEPAEIDDIGLLDVWPIDTGHQLDVRIGRKLKGRIDEVRIYDRALDADEVKALFEQK